MKHALAYLAIMIAAAPAAAQTTRPIVPRSRRAGERVRLVQLKVRPMAAPRAALRYQFLPTFLDQTPGHAAQYYYLAAQFVGKRELPEIDRLCSMPLKELQQSRQLVHIDSFSRGPAFHYLELAARREWCRWDLPLRQEPISMILPNLSAFRRLARMLSVHARVQIARKQHDEAIHTLQTGFAMARHMAEGPTLIQSLVGTAIAALMLKPIEDMIQQPDAPNLYWALTALPSPSIDLRRSMQWEHSMLYLMVPRLRNLESARLTRQQWRELSDDLAKAMATYLGGQGRSGPSGRGKAGLTAMAIWLYPRAKQYVISKGKTPKEVEAMPVQQVITIYTLETYVHVKDESFKWFHVPYWQAREGMQKADQTLGQAGRQYPGNPFLALVPALSRAYFLTTRVDQKIAALRCVEAVRMYAAGHEGKLPANLGEITEVPIPIDPITGKGFVYKVVGNTITLEGPAPKGVSARDRLRYEVTFLKN